MRLTAFRVLFLGNLIFIFNNQAWSVAGRCQDNWTLYNDVCYRAFLERAKFKSALSICGSHMASMVTVKNNNVSDFMEQLLAYFEDDTFWLGLYVQNGTARWIDGDDVSWSIWRSSRWSSLPDACPLMVKGRYWTMENCHFLHQYICQKPATEMSTTSQTPSMVPPSSPRQPLTHIHPGPASSLPSTSGAQSIQTTVSNGPKPSTETTTPVTLPKAETTEPPSSMAVSQTPTTQPPTTKSPTSTLFPVNVQTTKATVTRATSQAPPTLPVMPPPPLPAMLSPGPEPSGPDKVPEGKEFGIPLDSTGPDVTTGMSPNTRNPISQSTSTREPEVFDVKRKLNPGKTRFDHRPSAVGIGSVGVFILVAILVGIFILDASSLYRDFLQLRRNLKHICHRTD